MLLTDILKSLTVTLLAASTYASATPSPSKLNFQQDTLVPEELVAWGNSASQQVLGGSPVNDLGKKPYEGHQVIRIPFPKSRVSKKALEGVLLNTADVDVWKWRKSYVDVGISQQNSLFIIILRQPTSRSNPGVL
jgi:hypothetical protein